MFFSWIVVGLFCIQQYIANMDYDGPMTKGCLLRCGMVWDYCQTKMKQWMMVLKAVGQSKK